MLVFVFWFSLFMIFYAYFGYIAVLSLIRMYQYLFGKKRDPSIHNRLHPYENIEEHLPKVSFIITVFNEEQRIAEKLENSLAQTYPQEKLEIIVASDCSDDNTDSIALGFGDRGVRHIRAPERKGKENAQMLAVQASIGDILVFSDVATILKPDAIELIVHNFLDASIGCVSSEDRFIDRNGQVSGEGLYVRYEMYLRKLESKVNSLVGLSGSFFAARREVCQNWAPDLQSDFNTLLNSIQLGLKGVLDPQSIGYYENIADERKEFQRKVRTVLRGITVLMHNNYLLNPRQYGLFAWQLFSHKLCRWTVPLFMLTAFFSNIFILNEAFYYVLILILQVLFYAAALHHFALTKKSSPIHSLLKGNANQDRNTHSSKTVTVFRGFEKIAFYFLSVNISILVAWLKYFKGERAIYWQPSQRKP